MQSTVHPGTAEQQQLATPFRSWLRRERLAQAALDEAREGRDRVAIAEARERVAAVRAQMPPYERRRR